MGRGEKEGKRMEHVTDEEEKAGKIGRWEDGKEEEGKERDTEMHGGGDERETRKRKARKKKEHTFTEVRRLSIERRTLEAIN